MYSLDTPRRLQKFEKNLPQVNFEKSVKYLQIFVASSEYLNFETLKKFEPHKEIVKF